MTMRVVAKSVLAVAVTVGAVGCAEEEQASSEAVSPIAASPAWLLEAEPAGALSVTEVKSSSQEGETVVLRGRIGGRAEPIAPGSPVFTVMDLSVAYCGQESDDGCPTPWDYCCETPETIQAHGATVQVVGASDLTGLAALDEVVVVGTVGPRPTPQVLTIKATGVHRASD